jgi:transposase
MPPKKQAFRCSFWNADSIILAFIGSEWDAKKRQHENCGRATIPGQLQIIIGQHGISLAVESTTREAFCPDCQTESREVHSRYVRCPIDLAWADKGIVLHLKVKRFFCRKVECPKWTFAERFPGFIVPYARRTDRVMKKQQRVAVNTCATVAEKLLEFEQIRMSDSTINRFLRDLPEPEFLPTRVMGVDDWAKCKGQSYGTILVDLERGQVIDLLDDRTAETLAQWLQAHPGIEIIRRDRSQTYAEGITKGNPDAIQVADRWHLLKNLSDAVFKILQQEHPVIKKRLGITPPTEEIALTEVGKRDTEETITLAEERRKHRIEKALELLLLGWTQKSVAQHLNVHPKTVRRYLQYSSHKSTRSGTGSRLDPFKPYILTRWNEGCHNAAQLYREIEPQGFTGQETTVRLFVQQLRLASGFPPKIRIQQGHVLRGDPTHRPPSLRKLPSMIDRRPENRTDEDERLLEKFSDEQPKLITTIGLARTFSAIVRQQEHEAFDAWLEQASKSGYLVWKNFAEGLKQDYDAVHAALSLSWSNGPTEGHVNRLKYLKRQMYGRGKEDLLRKRVLWQGRWSFT